MLDRVKDGGPYVAVKMRALDREQQGRTRLWAEHIHSHVPIFWHFFKTLKNIGFKENPEKMIQFQL